MRSHSLLAVVVIASSSSGLLQAETIELGDQDCYRELASIDFGHSSESLEDNRFHYVFQHVDEYPYYRVVEAVFIGIQTPRTELGALVPNRNYWSFVPGARASVLKTTSPCSTTFGAWPM